jgi:hypothetical protein
MDLQLYICSALYSRVCKYKWDPGILTNSWVSLRLAYSLANG